MSARLFLTIIFFIGIFISGYIKLKIHNELFDAKLIGGSLGGALALISLPSLVLIPWRLMQKRSGYFDGKPFFASSIIFLVFSFLAINGSIKENQVNNTSQSKKTSFVYSPDGCKHLVVFPSYPEMKKILTAENLSFYQASYYTKSLMRSECIIIKSELNEASVINLLQNYSKQNGLQNTVFHIETKLDGMYGTIRGYKTVGGVWSTYEIKIVVSSSSILSLIVGGTSSDFPSAEITNFLQSIKPNS